MRKYCFCLWAIALMACNSKPKQTTENTKIDKDQTTTVSKEPTTDTIAELQVESFDLPATLQGCSGVYASDSTQLQQGKYILVNNMKDTAYIKINGRLMPLVLQKKTTDNIIANEVYADQDIQVIVNTTEQKKLGEELTQYAGELIIRKSGQEIRMPVIGQVGC
jgi:hypothetical protein